MLFTYSFADKFQFIVSRGLKFILCIKKGILCKKLRFFIQKTLSLPEIVITNL
jgi:hypothetical protein